MQGFSAAACAGLALWCSLGTLGLIGAGALEARVALLPPWWLLPALTAALLAAIRLLRLSRSQRAPLFASGVAILPWLPLPLPPAALVWAGPFVLAVWMAVVLGVIIGDGPVRSRWLTDARRAPLAAAIVALALYAGSAVWLSPVLPDGDSPHYLILAQSLIRDRDLRIENNHQRGDYLEYSLHASRPHYLRRGVDGAIYSIHAPGVPALIAPAFALGGYRGVVAFLGLVAAIATGLVWRLSHRVTGSASAAWFGWACCALTTPFFFQATQVFPDGLAATCVLLGTLPLILRSGTSSGPEGPSRDGRMWLISGLSLALLPWLQTRLAIVATAAGLCLCVRVRRVRHLVLFAAVPVVSAVAWFGYFYAIYGTANPAAPYGPYTQTTVANLRRGFPGLLFDQQFGLIPNAPVYGFVLAGVIAGAMRLRRWTWEVLIVLVPYMIGVGMFQIWWGGTSAPARLLTPVALLLGVAAARIWHETRTPATKALGLATLGVSVLVTAALAVPDRGRLLLNFRDGVALWLEWGNDLLDLPRGVPSLFRDPPGQAWLKTGIWAVSFAVAWLVLRAVAGGGERRPGKALQGLPVWATTWCLAASVMVALTLAWRVDGVPSLTAGTAELGLLRRASRHSRAYDYGARRFDAPGAVLARARVRTDRQRRAARGASLLAASDVPAGAYNVHVIPSGPAEGNLTLRVGPTPLPLWTTSVSGAESLSAGFPIRLPVDVSSVVVDGDEGARRTISAVELEPARLGPPFVRAIVGTSRLARQAARYGAVDAFFMDQSAYPEPSGFWVAGGHAAEIVFANNGAPLHLFLRNARVGNVVTIEVGGERQELSLRAREERTMALPRPSGAAGVLVRIHSRSGFRPSEADPANADLRYLGCWVEIR